MVEEAPPVAESVRLKSKTFYKIVIIINLIFGIGHAAYTFLEYTTLDEPALWFFSGSLAILFNTGLNVIYAADCKRSYFVITLVSNTTLLAFSIVLAVIILEPQTFGFAVTMAITVVAGIIRRQSCRLKFNN